MEVEEEIEALKAILGEENVFFDIVSRTVSVHYADMLNGLQIVYTLPGTVSTTAVGTCAHAYTNLQPVSSRVLLASWCFMNH